MGCTSISPSSACFTMQPEAGILHLPTQVRHLGSAAGDIADIKAMLMESPPPFQKVPVELRGKYMEKLESVVELANTMDDNLDRLYLLIDRSKLQHVVGAIVYAQAQMRMCKGPVGQEPRFIMTYEDATQSQRLLEDLAHLLSAVIAWTSSEEGTWHRQEINRAHAAMSASFDRWLDAALPYNFMDLNISRDDRSTIPKTTLLSSSTRSTSTPSLSHRPSTLPHIIIKTLPDAPSSPSGPSQSYPVTIPPPMSPLCRYRHAKTRTCRYCQDVPRQPRSSASRRSPYAHSSDTGSTHKRAKDSVCSSHPDDTVVADDASSIMSSMDSPPNVRAPSVISLLSDSSSDASSCSSSFFVDPEELELRPLLDRGQRETASRVPQSKIPAKIPLWLRILRELFPFF